jgi:hypothetical protein
MASFKSTFAEARKAGKKTFSWNGKSYTTELAKGRTGPKERPSAADMKGPMPRKVSGTPPKPRPSSVKTSMGVPELKPDNLGNLSQRTKNAEARAAAKAAKNKDRKSKTQAAAAALRKRLGFDK